jgi:uncharacterized protein (DUF3820 family)
MFNPKLFISIGSTGAMFTLRETYRYEYFAGGAKRYETRSFHHFNLGQDPDQAFTKAIAASLKMGVMLGTSREQLDADLRNIKRMNKEQREERDRMIAENNERMAREYEQYKITQRDSFDNGIMSFGAHKGKHIDEVPDSYLRWLVEQIDEFEEGSILRYAAERIKFKYTERLVDDFDPNAVIGKIGERIETEIKVIKKTGFYRQSFSGFGDEYVYVITMQTPDRTCVVSMSPSFKLEEGTVAKIKGTVKDHKEYKGQMQTIINRVKVAK